MFQLFLLEELRERKYNYFARVIQRAFKKYFASRQRDKHKNEAARECECVFMQN